jgi:hypothetical protein
MLLKSPTKIFLKIIVCYLIVLYSQEHRHWHSMPPYMGQKIRIENGQPIIIDRYEEQSPNL